MVGTTYRVIRLVVAGNDIPVAHGWLTTFEPAPDQLGQRGWESEVESEETLPGSLLNQPRDLLDVEITANWATFVGKARVASVSNERSLRLLSSEPEPDFA